MLAVDDVAQIFKMDIVNDEIVCQKVALSEKYAIFDSSNVSYTNKRYKTRR